MTASDIKVILDRFGGSGYLTIRDILFNKKKVEIEVVDSSKQKKVIIPPTQVKKEWYKVESARKKVLAEVGITDKEQIIQLVKYIDDKYKTIELEKKKPEIKPEYDTETKEKAMELLKDPAWFHKLGQVFEKGMLIKKINKERWILGEKYKTRLLPSLIFESRIGKITNTTLAGTPATGKEVLARMSITLTNTKAIERSRVTGGAMEQSEKIKNCDLIYLREDENVHGEKARQRRGMRGDDGGLETERLKKDAETEEYSSELMNMPGKSFLTTTNDVSRERALASDTTYLEMDDTEELNKEVMHSKLKSREPKFKKKVTNEENIKIWQCAFDMLVENYDGREITIPNFSKLLPLFNTNLTDYRRMPDIIADFIDSIVVQRTFQKPENKKYEADMIDLFMALRIGEELFKRSERGVTENQKTIIEEMRIKVTEESSNGETVELPELSLDIELSTSEIVKLTGLDQPTVNSECNNLTECGILSKIPGSRGRGHENRFKLLKNVLENKEINSLFLEDVELENKVNTLFNKINKINPKNVYIYLFHNVLPPSAENALENKELIKHNNKREIFSNVGSSSTHTLIDPITGIDILTCFDNDGNFSINKKEGISAAEQKK